MENTLKNLFIAILIIFVGAVVFLLTV